ncbi:hypothetical protein DM02DRAFT_429100 [Periconia macrospinosa]|uniref:Uncharacterized protein n=1 Tax=Periconia macrospinosa TaxID=97972 RepID=A0A2V1DN06_9PLEO|nr:hypothetical protein DM02DRAFT_429100 [Periconia macrospinosa]
MAYASFVARPDHGSKRRDIPDRWSDEPSSTQRILWCAMCMFVLVALFGAASTSCFIGAAIRQVATIFEALEAARWMLTLFESLEIGHLASYLHHPPAEQLIGVFFPGQLLLLSLPQSSSRPLVSARLASHR